MVIGLILLSGTAMVIGVACTTEVVRQLLKSVFDALVILVEQLGGGIVWILENTVGRVIAVKSVLTAVAVPTCAATTIYVIAWLLVGFFTGGHELPLTDSPIGSVALIATPVLAVASCWLLWAMQRRYDWLCIRYRMGAIPEDALRVRSERMFGSYDEERMPPSAKRICRDVHARQAKPGSAE